MHDLYLAGLHIVEWPELLHCVLRRLRLVCELMQHMLVGNLRGAGRQLVHDLYLADLHIVEWPELLHYVLRRLRLVCELVL